MHLGPQHMHRLAALSGEDLQRLGLAKAAPVRQSRTPQVQPQCEQRWIGSPVAPAGKQIHVVAPRGGIPLPPPGGGAGFQQVDQ